MGGCLSQRVNIGIDLDALPPGATTERDLTWFGFSALADLSSDGKWVLFTEFRREPAEGGVTYLRKTDGTPAVRLGDGHALALSPDGKWALCLLTSPARLVVIPTGVGERRTLPGPELNRVEERRGFPTAVACCSPPRRTGEGVRAYVQDIDGGQRTAGWPRRNWLAGSRFA